MAVKVLTLLFASWQNLLVGVDKDYELCLPSVRKWS